MVIKLLLALNHFATIQISLECLYKTCLQFNMMMKTFWNFGVTEATVLARVLWNVMCSSVEANRRFGTANHIRDQHPKRQLFLL
jgi:cellobiose-specific phosphotransferase system component IIC